MKTRAKSTLGQTLVEFALVLSVSLLIIFGIFDFGSTFQAWLTVQNCAQTAARYATTGQTFQAGDAARLQAIKDEARSRAAGLSIVDSAGESEPGYFHVYVYSADSPAGTESPGGPNTRVAVDVIFNQPMITPLLSKMFPYLRLTGHSEMVTERYRFPGFGTPAGVLPSPIPPTPLPTFTLTTAISPAGGGTISPAAGVNTYDYGTIVPVTAIANTGYAFSSWSGACAGSGTCSVTMDGNKTVTANFTILPTYKLTTAVSPTGGGTIIPAGVNTYYSGTIVPVTASANTGYAFSNWSGACNGSLPCSVTMDADKSVTANFTTVTTYILTTAVNRSGWGTISPSAGTHTYNQGTVVPVTATAANGHAFNNWSGACTGSGICLVTMNGNKTVTANFR
jgi:uncharacterized repeat protein (TIGR02543 family)